MNLIDKDKLLEALAEAQKQPCVSLRKLVEEQPVYILETFYGRGGAKCHSLRRQDGVQI